MTAKLLKTLALVTFLSLPLTTRSGEFTFAIGLTYSSGSYDAADTILDYYEDHYASMGDWDFDRFILPVGLTFNPYYEFDFGLGVGLSVGPTSLCSYRNLMRYEEFMAGDGHNMMKRVAAHQGRNFFQSGTGVQGVVLVHPVAACFKQRDDGLVEELFFSELTYPAEKHLNVPDGGLLSTII